jgi:hypothetical protein
MSTSSARTIGSLAVTAALIGLVLTAFFSAAGGGTVEFRETAVVFEGERAALPGVNETNVTANQSLGTAAQLDGSQDSYVSSASAPDVSGDWSVSTHVRVRDTTTTQIVYSDAGRVLLYNGSANEYVGVWYDSATGETYAVRETANDAENLTHLALVHNSSRADTLRLYEDDTDVATTASTTGESFAGDNLNGTLEETRVFNDSLSASERSALATTATAPLPGSDRAYRVMYDGYSVPSAFPAFFVDGSAGVGDINLVDGAAEQATERGTDWRLDGGEVVALDGGSLDGAPVVYVQYTGEFGALVETLQSLQNVVGGALNLLALGAIVVAAAVLLKSYDSF